MLASSKPCREKGLAEGCSCWYGFCCGYTDVSSIWRRDIRSNLTWQWWEKKTSQLTLQHNRYVLKFHQNFRAKIILIQKAKKRKRKNVNLSCLCLFALWVSCLSNFLYLNIPLNLSVINPKIKGDNWNWNNWAHIIFSCQCLCKGVICLRKQRRNLTTSLRLIFLDDFHQVSSSLLLASEYYWHWSQTIYSLLYRTQSPFDICHLHSAERLSLVLYWL